MRFAARLTSTASPTAPPIIWAVFTTPEASPDSAGSTPLIDARKSGLNEIAPPKPSRIIPGSTFIT